MELEEALDRLEFFVSQRDWDGMLSFAENNCKETAGEDALRKISAIDAAPYENALKAILPDVFGRLKKSHKAVYFEYDMDNDWAGNFFLCTAYSTRDKAEDEWAGDWKISIDGPQFPEFVEIFQDLGGMGTDAEDGVTVLLIARTAVALARPYCAMEKELNPNKIPFCIGFHDQETVWRIREKETGKPFVLKPAKKYPSFSKTHRIVPLEPIFDSLHCPGPEGLASARLGGKCGFVNKEGETVIPFQYDGVGQFFDGLASVRIDDKHGFINMAGKMVIEPRFEAVDPFARGVAGAKWDGKWGLIDNAGEIVKKNEWDEMRWPYDHNAINPEPLPLRAVQVGKKWGYINDHGELVIEPIVITEYPEYFSENLVGIVTKNRFGYMDMQGKWVIEYSDMSVLEPLDKRMAEVNVGPFREGIAAVSDTFYRGGFINREGKFIAHGGFMRDFREGVGHLQIPGKDVQAFVNHSGEIVLRFGRKKYKEPDGSTVERNIYFFGGGYFYEGLTQAVDKKNDKYVLIDHNGVIRAACDYFLDDVISEGVVRMTGRKDLEGYIDRDGYLLLEPKYKRASDFENGRGVIQFEDERESFAVLTKI